MRWLFHKLSTFSSVYAISGDGVTSCLAAAASVLPDALEFPFKGLIRHRTITHWPYLYLVLIIFFAWLFRSGDSAWAYVGLCVSGGALLHVCQDALSKTGIPIRGPFGPQRGLNFYKVYTLREAIIAFSLIVPCLTVSYFKGYFEPAYLGHEFIRLFSFGYSLLTTFISWISIF